MLQQIEEYTGHLPQLPDGADIINVTILMPTILMIVLRIHQGYVHLIIPLASPLVVTIRYVFPINPSQA